MAKVSTLINERLKNDKPSKKMTALAKATASGDLTSFSGVFHISELSDYEKKALENLLLRFSQDDDSLHHDLRDLISITSEVKAISNQAAMLHGERIQRAQKILKKYQEGAFSAWLVTVYGNRQTPYNFLQYFEFYEEMPKDLHPQIEKMPRQAVYSLASRNGTFKKKKAFVENYQGQTKEELIREIRLAFPLASSDKRAQDIGETTINSLRKIVDSLSRSSSKVDRKQKQALRQLLAQICTLVDDL